jgi:hypothetical protein
MLEHTLRYTLPAAYALLPHAMHASAASALLLAIGLQESQFLERRQLSGGPARGFFQFERAGIAGVLTHAETKGPIAHALWALGYEQIASAWQCLAIIEHNDTAATVFARLLLWTVPEALPARDQPMQAWNQYVGSWRPGKPRFDTWVTNYQTAWDHVEQRHDT